MIGFPNLFGGISLTMQRVAFHIVLYRFIGMA